MITTTTWAAGDYPAMAAWLGDAARLAVDRTGAGPGDHVLDIACGTGNAALIAAARGARVVGVDLEPRLLELAAERTAEAGVDVEWRQGDAGALDVEDGACSVVVSVFGVMYAADHDAAARELARCCAVAARVAIASWAPGSFVAAMGATLAPYLPPPPDGARAPTRWGDPAELLALLAPHGVEVTGHTPETIVLEFGDSDEAVAFLVRTAGHVVRERPRLEREGRWGDLVQSMYELVAERDAADEPGRVALPLDYLLATGLRIP